jgi:predicted unusual protein kinase regulating ubiquinone biosynthesis (AarF/ABC1/UbiB family)
VFKNIKWLNLEGFNDKMDRMLKIQLDLQIEAKDLVQFNHNCKGNKNEMFPRVRQQQMVRKILNLFWSHALTAQLPLW